MFSPSKVSCEAVSESATMLAVLSHREPRDTCACESQTVPWAPYKEYLLHNGRRGFLVVAIKELHLIAAKARRDGNLTIR